MIQKAKNLVKKILGISNIQSFSQHKEDLVIWNILRNYDPGFYVDVGAYHPTQLSNTNFLYENGWRGINIEPNPDLIQAFDEYRKGDENLNIVAGDKEDVVDFYFGKHAVHSSKIPTENTDNKPTSITQLPLNKVLEDSKITKNRVFGLLSVDTEGTEVEVFKGLDLQKYRPELIIAEFNTAGKLNYEQISYLGEQGYFPIYLNRWNIIYSAKPETHLKMAHSIEEKK